MSTSITKRLAAGAVALALGLTGAVAISAPAAADNGVGNITGTQGTLTIHKYERAVDSPLDPGTGQAIPGFTGEGLDDVTFTIQRVQTGSLLTAGGWNDVQAIADAADPIAAATAAGLTAAGSVTTSGGGVATATLPYALYLVTETATANTPSTITGVAAPFLVTIPFPTGPDAQNPNEWIYDVHVYPKNAVTGLEKDVVAPTEGELAHGDLVRWAIKADVPVLGADESFDTFTVSDVVDSAQLAFVTDAEAGDLGVQPTTVVVTDASGAAVSLTAGTDFTITPSPAAGDTLTVTFTESGRAAFETSAQGGQVTFTVLTRVLSVPADGILTNDAVSVVNDGENETSTTTTVGQLGVFKYAVTAGGAQQPLEGATFALYRDADLTQPVTVAGESEWTSDAEGLLSIPALRPGTYWLVETAAPAGYVLDATPREVTIVAGATTTTVNYVEVENEQVPAWELPLTGGDGALWFGVGGIALVAVAAGAAVLVARRQKAQA
ncbi:SpaH/EbpB family LPXTG-anchored major pilin [Microbacterium sp. NPDC055357]